MDRLSICSPTVESFVDAVQADRSRLNTGVVRASLGVREEVERFDESRAIQVEGLRIRVACVSEVEGVAVACLLSAWESERTCSFESGICDNYGRPMIGEG